MSSYHSCHSRVCSIITARFQAMSFASSKHRQMVFCFVPRIMPIKVMFRTWKKCTHNMSERAEEQGHVIQ